MNDSPAEQHVVVTAIRMPFWRMVGLLVKVALASIPAAVIVVFVVAFATTFASGLISGMVTASTRAKPATPPTPVLVAPPTEDLSYLIGLTPDEVRARLGTPTRTTSRGDSELLAYRRTNDEVVIQIVRGKVIAAVPVALK